MTDSRYSCRTLPQVRSAVRDLAAVRALPPEARARLVLSVADVARAALRGGDGVVLHLETRGGDNGHAAVAIRPEPAAAAPAPAVLDLPLPAERTPDGALVWRLQDATQAAAETGPPAAVPAPATEPPGDAPHASSPDLAPHEEELRAALAHIDALSADQRRLKHELAETNSGVLALYVQLEDREEEVRKAHGKVLRELEDALRPPPIAVEGLEMGVHYAPADSDAPTGGDLYDWFPLSDGSVHITVVDALGHGVKSTRSALNVTHAVRTLALEGHPLRSIIARTDEILIPFDRELMATVLLARLDPATGDLELANGSHPPALLLRADGTGELLETRGRGIGYPMPGSDQPLRTRLHPGDLLILYTDGLTESRRNPSEGELRLVDAARRHRSRPMAEIPHAIASDMHTVILHADDTLALAVRLTERRGHAAP